MSEMKKDLELFRYIVDLLLEDDHSNPVTPRIPIQSLDQLFDLQLNDNSMTDDELTSALKKIVLATPKTGTNRFFNQLFGGRQGKAIVGELLAVLLNSSMYTYKIGGPQIAIEKVIISKLCEMIKYGAYSGGTFPAGGSMSNYMAMIMARDVYDTNAKSFGISRRMIAYSSEESHYSVPKNASFAGIGKENVRFIKADPLSGQIVPELLNAQIEKDKAQGYTPFFVNLTSGTTVLGAFDPISPVADICEQQNLWLHIDGSLGGSMIFSQKYKHLLDGVERSDSFCVNAHKMLGTPLSCSMLLVKHKKHLYHSFSNEAEYLYQGDHDDYNLGKTSFQCGRRNDALKFWTLWKSMGTVGISTMVEHQINLADIARKYIRDHEDYTLYSFDNSVSVCFNYKNIDAKALCSSLYNHEELMVGYGNFNDDEFIRLVTVNANNQKEDILNFFSILEQHVERHFN